MNLIMNLIMMIKMLRCVKRDNELLYGSVLNHGI